MQITRDLNYRTQNYWGSVHRPSSGIVKTRKHSVSATGFVSALR
jgi:hypothetical protein